VTDFDFDDVASIEPAVDRDVDPCATPGPALPDLVAAWISSPRGSGGRSHPTATLRQSACRLLVSPTATTSDGGYRSRNAYAPYVPLQTTKAFAEKIWIVYGPEIGMRCLGVNVPFATRMTVVRTPGGKLWAHSPIAAPPPEAVCLELWGASSESKWRVRVRRPGRAVCRPVKAAVQTD
jgi:hypothetical protein